MWKYIHLTHGFASFQYILKSDVASLKILLVGGLSQ